MAGDGGYRDRAGSRTGRMAWGGDTGDERAQEGVRRAAGEVTSTRVIPCPRTARAGHFARPRSRPHPPPLQLLHPRGHELLDLLRVLLRQVLLLHELHERRVRPVRHERLFAVAVLVMPRRPCSIFIRESRRSCAPGSGSFCAASASSADEAEKAPLAPPSGGGPGSLPLGPPGGGPGSLPLGPPGGGPGSFRSARPAAALAAFRSAWPAAAPAGHPLGPPGGGPAGSSRRARRRPGSLPLGPPGGGPGSLPLSLAGGGPGRHPLGPPGGGPAGSSRRARRRPGILPPAPPAAAPAGGRAARPAAAPAARRPAAPRCPRRTAADLRLGVLALLRPRVVVVVLGRGDVVVHLPSGRQEERLLALAHAGRRRLLRRRLELLRGRVALLAGRGLAPPPVLAGRRLRDGHLLPRGASTSTPPRRPPPRRW